MATINSVGSSGVAASVAAKSSEKAGTAPVQASETPAVVADKASISDEGRAKLAQDATSASEAVPAAKNATAADAAATTKSATASPSADKADAAAAKEKTTGEKAKKLYEDVADSVKSAAHKVSSWVSGGDGTPAKGA